MTTTMEDQQIAETILRQLGGRRLSVMTGAKDFCRISRGLQFKLPRAAKSINTVRIVLDANDTYTVQFARWTVRKLEATKRTISEFTGIYCGQLIELFESETGLYAHL